MDFAGRAETWLRLRAAELIGTSASPGEPVDPRGVLGWCLAAKAFSALGLLDGVTVEGVTADLVTAAAVRGRVISMHPWTQSALGLVPAVAVQATGSPAAAGAPWPPAMVAGGACTAGAGPLVQLLWMTRRGGRTSGPALVRPESGAGPRASFAAPRPPALEVVGVSGGRHDVEWEQGAVQRSCWWGTASIVGDLPAGGTLTVGPAARAGDGAGAGAVGPDALHQPDAWPELAAVHVAPCGMLGAGAGTPDERFLDRHAWPGWATWPEQLPDDLVLPTWRTAREALAALDLVDAAYEPRPPVEGATVVRAPEADWTGGHVPVVSGTLGATMPFERGPVFVEGFTLDGDRMTLFVQVAAPGEPAGAPWWHAEDGRGTVRVGSLARSRLGGATWEVTFHVPAGTVERRLRVVASSPFEAGFVEVEVPPA